MAYGSGSTRRLRFVVEQLRHYITDHIARFRKPLSRRAALSADLSPPLAVAFMRGEAILNLRFFSWCESLGIGLEDPSAMWAMHQRLIADRGRILDLINRTGLYQAISTQVELPPLEGETAYRLYCGLLDDLDQAEKFRLLEIATDYFFLHAFRTLFPNRTLPKAEKNSVQGLKASVMSRLRKKIRAPFELKESFRQGEEEVEFHLRLKIRNKWLSLPVVTGKRLKTTRLNAYEALLNTLKTGHKLEELLSPQEERSTEKTGEV